MKILFALTFLLAVFLPAAAQNEQAPLVEKQIAYQNWKFNDARTGDEMSFRRLAGSKRLVMVVYFAPWCHGWQFDAPVVERLYEKYKDSGLQVIGVGEYGTKESIRASLDTFKITFPVVYESESEDQRRETSHFRYRKATGDDRGWGSPWYIFLDKQKVMPDGDVVAREASVVNGEIIEPEIEKMIRQKLGLPELPPAAASLSKPQDIQPCDSKPAKP